MRDRRLNLEDWLSIFSFRTAVMSSDSISISDRAYRHMPGYVHPRSKKSTISTGIGTPKSHNRIQPIFPDLRESEEAGCCRSLGVFI
jgi:hypothetical protein